MRGIWLLAPLLFSLIFSASIAAEPNQSLRSPRRQIERGEWVKVKTRLPSINPWVERYGVRWRWVPRESSRHRAVPKEVEGGSQ